jgi:flagellar hook-associated protein 1 FlgK
MAGLFNAINAARTSLEVNQKSIEVIGNNIANQTTDGYSRQQAIVHPFPAMHYGDFFVGHGVKIADIRRENDIFIDRQIRGKAVDLGMQEAMSRPLGELERVFGVGDNSLSTSIDSFFDAVQELSADPADLVQRNNVIFQGQALATGFTSTVAELDSIKENINISLLSKIETINAQLSEVADLNDRIASIEVHGQTANSARDQRDLLAKSLAGTIGAIAYEDSRGMLALQLPTGLPLVQGGMAMSLSAEFTGSNLNLQLQAGGVTRDLNLRSLGGEFHGLLTLRDSFIPSLNADLDRLAYELAVAVNLQHQAGTGLDSTSGNLFFSMPPNYQPAPPDPTAAEYLGAARQLAVVLTDPNQLAAGFSSAPGDNRNALAIAAIGREYRIGGTDSFTSLYGKIAATVGSESNQNQLFLKGAEDAMVQLENFRDGLVGVSLEEEMISLIQYQRGFQSSAKFLSTVDEMLSALMEIRR